MNNSKNAQKRIRQKALNTARKNSGNENQAFNNKERIRKDPRLKALNLINPVEGTPRVPTLADIKTMYGAPATLAEVDADTKKANDAAIGQCHSLLHHAISIMGMSAYPQFLGYGYLTGLAQNGLIRAGCEMIADEMVEKGITLTTKGNNDPDTDKQAKLDRLNELITKINLLPTLRKAVSISKYYGGSLVYMDFDGIDTASENLLNPLILTKNELRGKKLRRLKVIEPYNLSPGQYNAADPLQEYYFKPRYWFVMGKAVDASRFLPPVQENELPTILRPAYNFFGIPLAQIVLDAVAHFTECREAEARLLTKFSLTVFKTNLNEQIFSGGDWAQIDNRVNNFVQYRSNDGVMLIDKESEDIDIKSTSLAGVKDIVSQAMEIVAAYFNEPVTKMWGLTPSGFNTGESDLNNHYDHIASQQEKQLRDQIEYVLKVLQVQEWGEIDNEITFTFNPLSEEKEESIATVNKIKAETQQIYISNGVISPDEGRECLKADPKSGFNNLNEESVPEEELSEEERELLGLTEKREVLSQDERLAEDSGGKRKRERQILKNGGRWITINGSHVLIDSQGTIVMGNENLLNKNIKDFDETDEIEEVEEIENKLEDVTAAKADVIRSIEDNEDDTGVIEYSDIDYKIQSFAGGGTTEQQSEIFSSVLDKYSKKGYTIGENNINLSDKLYKTQKEIIDKAGQMGYQVTVSRSVNRTDFPSIYITDTTTGRTTRIANHYNGRTRTGVFTNKELAFSPDTVFNAAVAELGKDE
jgi:phage-related protein (TIGR01555 family)|nr:MAG TPA: portal [Caudoviricetes sp.]